MIGIKYELKKSLIVNNEDTNNMGCFDIATTLKNHEPMYQSNIYYGINLGTATDTEGIVLISIICFWYLFIR